MKPDWDSLASTYEDSKKVIIADVDCTAGGKPLCDKYGVRGYPTIKYFNPPDEEGEDYKGGRDLPALKKFVESDLGPGCSVDSKENCSEQQLKELQTYVDMDPAEREAKMTKMKDEMKAAEDAHNELLKKLQAQFKESQDALEKLKEDSAPVIKMLKAATPSAPKGGKDEVQACWAMSGGILKDERPRELCAVLVVGNEDFSLPENVYKNFNVANWLRTFPHPLKSEAVKLPMKAVVKFIVSVDLLDFQYIGIKDEYNDEGNCNNYVFGDPTHAQFRNWKRFTPESPKDLFDDDFTIRGYERSLMFAVQASPLSEIQAALGLGDPSGGLWKENLEKNKCKRARIFIPIDWSGHGSEDCSDEEPEEGAAPPPMIKSVMISQTEGIKEICDGSRMAIQDTYYLEVLIMQEADATYKVPSDVELKQAKKHGYILQDPDQAFEFSANGFNTKVRAWVKADTTGFNTRNLICRGTPFKEGIKFKVSYE